MEDKKIKTALISVYYKDHLEEIVRMLDSLQVYPLFPPEVQKTLLKNLVFGLLQLNH